MTALPEAKLAREAEIAQATLAMITDYDAWKVDEAPVTAEQVGSHVANNAATAKAMIKKIISKIPTDATWPEHRSLDGAIMTPQSGWPAQTVTNLKPILQRFLKN
jgi:5'-methylthioadenosine phosphorylase